MFLLIVNQESKRKNDCFLTIFLNEPIGKWPIFLLDYGQHCGRWFHLGRGLCTEAKLDFTNLGNNEVNLRGRRGKRGDFICIFAHLGFLNPDSDLF